MLNTRYTLVCDLMEAVIHHSAERTLADCERALGLLESVPSGDAQLFRIYWMSCLILLRKVNDDLLREANSNPRLKLYLSRRFLELQEIVNKTDPSALFSACSLDYLIFERFLRMERNRAAHEVSEPYSLEPWECVVDKINFNLGDLYLTMGDLEYWGDWDCRDWVLEGIKWWRAEIESIDRFLKEDAH